VVEKIESLQREKVATLNDMAILVRTSGQMRILEEKLVMCAVPYRVIGGLKFYERQEIRDAMAYLRLVAQPFDDLAFERILNKPKRGLADATLNLLHQHGRLHAMPLLEASKDILQHDILKPKPRTALREFIQAITRWQKMSLKMPLSELTEIILDESGYTDMLRHDKSPESVGRLDNLKELVRATQDFENLQGFLEHIALITDTATEQGSDVVTIMTLHGAKGLEFQCVFLPGWEDGLFPSQRSMDENGQAGIEEERRLAYVGITRAKKKLFISFAQNRRLYNQWQTTIPSRFIDEIPDEVCDVSRGTYFAKPKKPTMDYLLEDDIQTAGWQRAKNSYLNPTHTLIDMPKRPASPQHSFKKGDRVTHDKLGSGTILVIEGDRLVVQFDNNTIKNIMADFVVLN
jgi:DNA helicase-2/ATP-dependent DNA helicase PcrA